jgi:hypothetical protein
MAKASELTNQIIDHVYRSGGYAWRAASVGVFDSKRGAFRASAKKGVADVLACFNGYLICVEVKIGSDRLSLEQQGFRDNVIHAGGSFIEAREFDQFVSEWGEITKVMHSLT